MHKLMTGEDDSFDKSFYNELVSCINKYDPELMDVINAQWKGFRSYAHLIFATIIRLSRLVIMKDGQCQNMQVKVVFETYLLIEANVIRIRLRRNNKSYVVFQ